jgi:uncharacterized membrane protein
MARMTSVEGRLGRVERSLGLSAPPEKVKPPQPLRSPLAPPPLPVRPAEEPELLQAEIIDSATPPASIHQTPASRPAWTPQRTTARPQPAQQALENTIGRNWTSWIGAIVVVLGVLFFLKYAWDQGWLALSPAARVGTTIGAGVLFALAGEWVRRRQMRVLAGTLAGIGVAIVMAAFLAGYALFDHPVFSARIAAAGVCITAAGGIALALRNNIMTLAIIALLGAYIAPAILHTGRDESLLLMIYLGALASVGWVLSYLKSHWSAVRWFAWVWTALWMTVWIARFGLAHGHTALALAAVTFFFTGFQAEAVLTIRRVFRIRDESKPPALTPQLKELLENALALLSLLTTAAAFAACFVLLHDDPAEASLFHLNSTAATALGLACLQFAVAQATPSRQFVRSCLLQAASLVTLAIPLALGHVAITSAWLVLAITLAALAWRRSGQFLRAWSVALLGLALLRLFTFDFVNIQLRQAIWNIAGCPISPWLLIACASAIAAHAIAWLCGSDNQPPTDSPHSELGTVLAGIGTAVFLVAATIHFSGLALTVAWLVWAIALVAVARTHPGDRFKYAPNAAVVLVLAMLKWLALDGLQPIIRNWNHATSSMLPLFNSVTLSGAVLIVLMIWLSKALSQQAKSIVPAGVAVIGFAIANFETLRAVDYFASHLVDFATVKLVALSVLWAVIGLVAVVAGFARHLRPLRYAALILLGITLAKILFIDLAKVQPVYRILSFLAVGMLLLCVSFVYHRQTDRHLTT